MTHRNFDDILSDCVDIIEKNYYGAQAETDGDYNDLAAKIENLGAELALCPGTYYAISELFSEARRGGENTADVGPSDDPLEYVEEDMSLYDEDGLFANLEDSRSSVLSSSLNLSPDIANYLSSTR